MHLVKDTQQNSYSENLHKYLLKRHWCKKGFTTTVTFYRKAYLPESPFLKPAILLKKTQPQMFSCEFCENFKNSFLKKSSRRLLLFIYATQATLKIIYAQLSMPWIFSLCLQSKPSPVGSTSSKFPTQEIQNQWHL